ncbi:MAG: hypothetical protein ABI759_06885 [Candidatus Solibacter sp.]
MNFNLVPLVVVWGVLALVVLGLFIWRKSVASDEDDTLHVSRGVLTQQVAVAQKLDMIDKWGKILTLIAVISGLLIAAAYVYGQFVGRAALGA